MSENSQKPVELVVPSDELAIRLDLFLSMKISDYSRSYLQKLIKNGSVLLNDTVKKTPKTMVSSGDKISIDWPVEDNFEIPKGEDFSYTVLFEDEDLIVIDKPSGVVVHPAAGNRNGTIVNALIGRDDSFAENLADESNDILSRQRPGIVHRLDKDTSGCLVIAKNVLSKQRLSESFASREMKKTYSALTYGIPEKYTGEIKTLIGRHPVNRKKMAVVKENGKEAITLYKVDKTGKVGGISVSLLNVNILTGRTHQIRVHLAYIKSPVLGDKVYGGHQKINPPRQMLHARKIAFSHPMTGKIVSITCPYPEDFQSYLNLLT